ncbi:MAG: hypothetical protein J5705_03010 [Bacteroidaceae bacterium]|nr:hypothetical protein [Bacteroidaceae bacterium]
MTKLSAFGFTLFLTCMYGVASAQIDTLQITDFELEEKEITLKIGESYQLNIDPAGTKVTWWGGTLDFSVNPVSYVDENGMVTAFRAGSSYAAAESSEGAVRKWCQVTVLDEGSIRKDNLRLDPTDECEWTDIKLTLNNDGVFKAQGAFYGSGSQINYLNYILTDQCIFIWFDINYEDSTRMFYPQPFSLEIYGCNAKEYNVYLNNRIRNVESQGNFVRYSIQRGSSTDGQDQTSYDAYYYGWSSNVYLHQIPGKFFIKKSSGASQDWLVSLLYEQLGDQFRIGWMGNDMCKVVVDDSSIDIDKVIFELLKEDDVLVARYIYVTIDDLERYLKDNRTDLESSEMCPLNGIVCGIKGEYSKAAMDSLANALGLTYEYNMFGVSFSIPKTSDIFELIHELYNSGYFTYVSPDSYMMVVLSYTTNVGQITENVQSRVYYNMSGSEVDSPSGLTIVVTRYSDGSVHSEKKFFR